MYNAGMFMTDMAAKLCCATIIGSTFYCRGRYRFFSLLQIFSEGFAPAKERVHTHTYIYIY